MLNCFCNFFPFNGIHAINSPVEYVENQESIHFFQCGQVLKSKFQRLFTGNPQGGIERSDPNFDFYHICPVPEHKKLQPGPHKVYIY